MKQAGGSGRPLPGQYCATQESPSLNAPPAAPVIVWFRDDLRLSDHPALNAAASTGAPVICLYVLDESPSLRPPGGAARWWLAQSLRALQRQLGAIGSTLAVSRGAAAKVIPTLARAAQARAVVWNEIADKSHRAIEFEVAAALRASGIDTQSFPGDLLVAPQAIRSKDGRGMRVFTPFWKRVLAMGDPPKPLPAPTSLRWPTAPLASKSIESFGLEPTKPDWAAGLRKSWLPGEEAAQARLTRFLSGDAKSYAGERNRPDRDVTSGLSPHLRFGEISPR